MKKGLYIVNFGYKITDEEKTRDGVLKKIIGQIEAFNDVGIDVNLLNVYEKKLNYFSKFFYSLFNKNQYLSGNYKAFEDIDFVFIRHFLPINIGCINLLAYLYKRGCKIIYELPTYPYDKEHRGITGLVFLMVDHFFRRFLRKYVHYVATYSNDDEIFGIPTVKIMNGINCAKIPVVKNIRNNNCMRLIAVAQFSEWHGYDRLIEGIYEYYQKKTDIKVSLDLVGYGKVLQDYKQKIIRYNLQEYITCHGILSGEALTDVFNKADIAVCSLANHRCSVFLSSELKSREYLARGLPMVSSTKIDILDDSFPYIHYLPEDDSHIDINSIIKFYDKLTKKENRADQIKNIRNFAEKYCDMKITMLPIIDKVIDN